MDGTRQMGCSLDTIIKALVIGTLLVMGVLLAQDCSWAAETPHQALARALEEGPQDPEYKRMGRELTNAVFTADVSSSSPQDAVENRRKNLRKAMRWTRRWGEASENVSETAYWGELYAAFKHEWTKWGRSHPVHW